MPKLKKSPKERLEQNLLANIAFYATLYGYKNSDMERILGVSPSTWEKRRKEPSTFRVIELQRLANNFRIPIEELFKVKEGQTS